MKEPTQCGLASDCHRIALSWSPMTMPRQLVIVNLLTGNPGQILTTCRLGLKTCRRRGLFSNRTASTYLGFDPSSSHPPFEFPSIPVRPPTPTAYLSRDARYVRRARQRRRDTPDLNQERRTGQLCRELNCDCWPLALCGTSLLILNLYLVHYLSDVRHPCGQLFNLRSARL
jgi:hypothetical protein